jgi:hypothetical protein
MKMPATSIPVIACISFIRPYQPPISVTKLGEFEGIMEPTTRLGISIPDYAVILLRQVHFPSVKNQLAPFFDHKVVTVGIDVFKV